MDMTEATEHARKYMWWCLRRPNGRQAYRHLRRRQRHPLQCSCLENPMDRGAWWAAVYGVTQSRTRLKRLSNSSSIEYESFPFCSWEKHINKPSNINKIIEPICYQQPANHSAGEPASYPFTLKAKLGLQTCTMKGETPCLQGPRFLN